MENATISPWSAAEANGLRRTAQMLLSRHDCQGSRLVEMRENCGACVLNGYMSSADRKSGALKVADGPNYAGWARVYVQAGSSIPRRWRKAFQAERDSDNRLYAEALERDIATWRM